MRTVLVMMAVAMMLAACGEQKKDVKDTVFAPQVKALEKARSVENTLKQGEEKNREALELSEKPTPPEQR
jgi:ABC-type uncharacterized transport system auxiliary subunit